GTLLEKNGYQVATASDGRSGLEKLESTLGKENEYDFILCDLKMPKMNGMDFLKSVRDKINKTTVIMMSASGTMDNAIEAMKLGAYDYISKPFKLDEVLLTLKKAEERESLKRENLLLKEQLQQIEGKYKFGNMIAGSKTMQSVFRLADKVTKYDTTVLIQGESGTGKELIARGIHLSGKRSKKPFVAVNCGSIPETLLESEFFGYKKGAFTGADKDKKGFFEEADKGSIFLDEIGELPLNLQVKLLRILQENEIRPLGDSKVRTIDVRVIAATSKKLEEEVKKGAFREDLFYRLNVLPIKIPPLRERIEDIPVLSNHFLKKFNKKFNKNISEISPGALSILIKHSWPGNVRELENIIERAVIFSEKKIILPENLPEEFGIKAGSARIDDFFKGFSIKKAQKIMEKRLILRALESTGGNRTKAGKLLEISHPSLLSKIKTYEI
nr:sigma-54-dependent Fis family transcriptional regulator [Desulfobacterales bacterium]